MRERAAAVGGTLDPAPAAEGGFLVTVKSHVARILAKLGLRDRVQIVVFAYTYGLAEDRSPSLP